MARVTTLKDIARKMNVSITTVSKALNNHPDISKERRKAILELAKEMNYVPNSMAKNLRRNKTKFVGLIVSDNTNPYYAGVIHGVEETLSQKGYHTLIFNNNEEPDKEIRFIHDLRSINVAGVIITPALGNAGSVRLLQDFGIPYVLAHRYLDKTEDNYVIVDDEYAGFIATKYLLEKGHKKILFLDGDPRISAAKDRFEGYVKALKEFVGKWDEDNVVYSGIKQEDGYRSMKKLLKQVPPPFALLCFSDYVATGALKALHEADLDLPGEVAVMGIDDIEMFSFMHPGLTTVHIPKRELGVRSAELLLDLIDRPEATGQNAPQHVILKPWVVIRNSA